MGNERHRRPNSDFKPLVPPQLVTPRTAPGSLDNVRPDPGTVANTAIEGQSIMGTGEMSGNSHTAPGLNLGGDLGGEDAGLEAMLAQFGPLDNVPDPILGDAPGEETLLTGGVTDPLLELGSSAGLVAPPAEDPQAMLDEAEFTGPAIEDMDPATKRAIAALYGESCPLAMDEQPDESDWVRWPTDLWTSLEAGVQPRLHGAQRNRKFYHGDHWVSSNGTGPWVSPPKPKDAARIVVNMVKPAIDMRIQVLAEQRPGFRTKPTSHDPTALRKAEARQLALEYQYDNQKMASVIQEAAYWAHTDGVSFPYLWWDADAGASMEAGPEGGYRSGDLSTCVYRMEQVRVSPNATANRRPFYWIVKEELTTAEAVAVYGAKVVDSVSHVGVSMNKSGRSTGMDTSRDTPMRGVGIAELHADQPLVDRFTIFCEPSAFLPAGLVMVVVGETVVAPPRALPWGRVPIFRWTDGAPDPAFYPAPFVEEWIPSQQLVNATVSKWVESVRRNADGRMAIRSGVVATETLIGGMTSAIEVRGAGAVSDAIQMLPSASVGVDTKELLSFAISAFEQRSGWNTQTRGDFQNNDSGRAILAQREVLERIFAPSVRAAARAMTEWAELCLLGMKWGYQQPRLVSVIGPARADLAAMVGQETFDGTNDVTIDEETMIPLPRTMRLFLLDDMLQKGLMSPQEYRRRMPFSFIGSIESPDEDHYSRAKRVCEAIRQTGDPLVLPVLWQDNEAIHQDVLERDLILPDDTDPMVRQAASMRWTFLAQQSMMKMAPAPQGPQSATGSGEKENPKTQSTSATGGAPLQKPSTVGGVTNAAIPLPN